jgi:hypothetical protein
MSFCVWCETELDNPSGSREVWGAHRYRCQAALESGTVMDAPSVECWHFGNVSPFGFRWSPHHPTVVWVYPDEKPGSPIIRGLAVAPKLQSKEGAIDVSKRFIRKTQADEEAERNRPARAPMPSSETRLYLNKMVKAAAMMTSMTEQQARLRLEILVGDMSQEFTDAKAAIDLALQELVASA